MFRIDLNCDMGESFGAYVMGEDAELIKHVTSANIACGFHGGDPGTMRSTVMLALRHGTAIGAHPGLPDLAGFGRRMMDISRDEAYGMTLYQIGALEAIARAEGGRLSHVKPHGALYHLAEKNEDIAEAIAEAVYKANGRLLLFGLSGGRLIAAAERIGLKTAHEVFADRAYEEDGMLTPRDLSGAVLHDVDEAVERVLEMVTTGRVSSRQGTLLNLKADTVCIHGDTPGAVLFAANLKCGLEQAGIRIARPDASSGSFANAIADSIADSIAMESGREHG